MSSGKRGGVKGMQGPTGRTTSPPAPRQRDQTAAQPARSGPADARSQAMPQSSTAYAGSGALGAGVLNPPGHQGASALGYLRGQEQQQQQGVGGMAEQGTALQATGLRMRQMITNAATKEQFESGSEDLPPAVSSIAFDKSGQHMAYGDRAGRCYIFTRNGSGDDQSDPSSSGYTLLDVVEAYTPQLDTLHSTEIEAKVNVIKFIDLGNGSLFFLTANDKCVKMWKIWDRARGAVEEVYEPINALLEGWSTLQFPKVSRAEKRTWHKEMKQFASDHEYHINSVSVSSNNENFVSSDDLTVQMWHLGHSERSLRVLDRRPDQMEDLSETITSCTYHSFQPQELYVANSKGVVSCYDLRTNLACADSCNTLTASTMPGPNVYLQSILAGISDIKSTPCGNYIVARDYLSVKVWDVRRGDSCVRDLHVHDDVHPRLTELYENDYLFDRFEVVTNHTGSEIYTGSYRSEFVQFDSNRESKLYNTDTSPENHPVIHDPMGNGAAVRGEPYKDMDFQSKVLSLAAHPTDNVLAVGCGHELFLYSA